MHSSIKKNARHGDIPETVLWNKQKFEIETVLRSHTQSCFCVGLVNEEIPIVPELRDSVRSLLRQELAQWTCLTGQVLNKKMYLVGTHVYTSLVVKTSLLSA